MKYNDLLKSIKNYLFLSCFFFFFSSVFSSSLEEKEAILVSQETILSSEREAENFHQLGDYYYLGQKHHEDPLKIKQAWIFDRKKNERYYYSIKRPSVLEGDYITAATCYEAAAKNNYTPSLWSLGECYELGRGVDLNYERAFTLYKKAAKHGYGPAQSSLAFMFQEGRGVLQDADKALRWYCLAALKQDVKALYHLSLNTLRKKKHVNPQEILMYLESAATHSYAPAQNTLGLFHQEKNEEMDDIKALKWFGLSAAQEYPQAQFNLGMMYMKGQGIKQDTLEAIKWFELAALQEEPNACLHLKIMNYQENLPEQDPTFIPECRVVALQGNRVAQAMLSDIYFTGEGVLQDVEESIKWYGLAADQGDVISQLNLATFYYFGKGVPKNFEEALRWYLQAAEQGSVDAQYMLGNIYHKGEGTDQNLQKALKWYQLAGQQGHLQALNNLKSLSFDNQNENG